jgi:hypothetical protein
MLSDDPLPEELPVEEVVLLESEDDGLHGWGDAGWLGVPHIIRPRTSATIRPMIRPTTSRTVAKTAGEMPSIFPLSCVLDWLT